MAAYQNPSNLDARTHPRHMESKSLGLKIWHPYFLTPCKMILVQFLEYWCLGTNYRS